MSSSQSRRRYLIAVLSATTTTSLSGCSGQSNDETPTNAPAETTFDGPTTGVDPSAPTDGATASPTGSATPTSSLTPTGTATSTDTDTATASPKPDETANSTATASPTPKGPQFSDAGQRMFETLKYHAISDRGFTESSLDKDPYRFKIIDYENQRQGTPEEVIEKQAETFVYGSEGIFNFEDVQAEIISKGQGNIVNLSEDVDIDEISSNFKDDRGYEDSGVNVSGTKILEGVDNIFNGAQGEKKKAAVAIDGNTLVYASKHSNWSDTKPVELVEKSLKARHNDKSIVDEWETTNNDGERVKVTGQLQPFTEEKYEDESFLYEDGVIDFQVNGTYTFMDGYKDALLGLSENKLDWGMGIKLQEENPKEEVTAYRTKFTDNNTDEILKHEELDEYPAAIMHQDYPTSRQPPENNNSSLAPVLATGVVGDQARRKAEEFNLRELAYQQAKGLYSEDVDTPLDTARNIKNTTINTWEGIRGVLAG